MKEVRIDVKLGLVGPKKRDAPRTASIEKLGARSRCYTSNSEYHYGPSAQTQKSPWRSAPESKSCEETSQCAIFPNCYGISLACVTAEARGPRRTGATAGTVSPDGFGY